MDYNTAVALLGKDAEKLSPAELERRFAAFIGNPDGLTAEEKQKRAASGYYYGTEHNNADKKEGDESRKPYENRSFFLGLNDPNTVVDTKIEAYIDSFLANYQVRFNAEIARQRAEVEYLNTEVGKTEVMLNDISETLKDVEVSLDQAYKDLERTFEGTQPAHDTILEDRAQILMQTGLTREQAINSILGRDDKNSVNYIEGTMPLDKVLAKLKPEEKGKFIAIGNRESNLVTKEFDAVDVTIKAEQNLAETKSRYEEIREGLSHLREQLEKASDKLALTDQQRQETQDFQKWLKSPETQAAIKNGTLTMRDVNERMPDWMREDFSKRQNAPAISHNSSSPSLRTATAANAYEPLNGIRYKEDIRDTFGRAVAGTTKEIQIPGGQKIESNIRVPFAKATGALPETPDSIPAPTAPARKAPLDGMAFS